MKNMLGVAAVAALGAVAVFPATGSCATYPEKPIRVIVPYPPGGATDLMARSLGEQLGEQFNRSVVLDNRGGAGGIIGVETVARSAPDG